MSKDRKNVYICGKCHREIVTIDIDQGVTPFAIPCIMAPACEGSMYSSFYKVSPDLVPQFEWFKPDDVSGYSPGEREHIEKGGLIMRELSK